MTRLVHPYPPSTVEPIVEVLHGVRVVDPFQWLEDQDSPRVRAWIEEQNLYCRALLDAIPGRDWIRRRVTEFLAIPVYSDVRSAGDLAIFLKREAWDQQPRIYIERDGREHELVDPTRRNEGSNTSVSIVSVSRDGRMLACGIKRNGEDSLAVEIVDVASGHILADRLPRGYIRSFAFSPDGKGFYYSLESPDPNRSEPRSVRYHQFGSAVAGDQTVFSIEPQGRPRLVSWLSDNGRWILHLVMYSGLPIRRTIYFQNLADRQPARVLWDHIPSGFVPLVAGDRVFVVETNDAPNGQIAEMSLGEDIARRRRIVVPEGQTRIEQVRVIGNRILVVDTVNVAHRVRIFDLEGRRLQDLPLPGSGTVRFFPAGTGDVFLQYSSIAVAPCIYRYTAGKDSFSLWRSRLPRGGMPQLEVRKDQYESKDGTAIPVTVFRRAGGSRQVSAPAILNGYGGFGASLTPEFTVLHTLLAEWGCVIAIPNIRGGSELGSAWHQAAKRRRRQTAFDDFVASAEWLITEGWTRPERLGIIGGSNGGLLVGAALTQRPDLFKAAVSIGPLLDMLRYHRFGHAHFWAEEYGTADDPEDFGVLHSYSPYHRVRDGVPYPATMLISGDADLRCDSAHARKMAARLQQASTSGLPVLLDYSAIRGHSPTLPLTQRIESLTDRLAFLCAELGVEVGS